MVGIETDALYLPPDTPLNKYTLNSTIKFVNGGVAAKKQTRAEIYVSNTIPYLFTITASLIARVHRHNRQGAAIIPLTIHSSKGKATPLSCHYYAVCRTLDRGHRSPCSFIDERMILGVYAIFVLASWLIYLYSLIGSDQCRPLMRLRLHRCSWDTVSDFFSGMRCWMRSRMRSRSAKKWREERYCLFWLIGYYCEMTNCSVHWEQMSWEWRANLQMGGMEIQNYLWQWLKYSHKKIEPVLSFTDSHSPGYYTLLQVLKLKSRIQAIIQPWQ